MQGAVSTAVTSAVKRLRASELEGTGANSACTPCVVDCLHVLCCWRDQQARQLDQGLLPALAAARSRAKRCAIVLALEVERLVYHQTVLVWETNAWPMLRWVGDCVN